MKTRWAELPSEVRAAVTEHVDEVTDVIDISQGASSDLTTVLLTRTGPGVFIKGVRGVSLRMRRLRNEITGGAIAVGVAPAVVFHADVGDWLLVGFERVEGRTASLAPGSADLPVVATAMEKLGMISAPELHPLSERWTLTDAWMRLGDENSDVVRGWDVAKMASHAALIGEYVDGSGLLHTDLHGEQFLIDEHGVIRVIDWAFPARGATWVDSAFLLLRLIEAGHQPEDAERWVLRLPGFAEIDTTAALDSFAAFISGLWTTWAVSDNPPSGSAHRSRLALAYAAHRFG